MTSFFTRIQRHGLRAVCLSLMLGGLASEAGAALVVSNVRAVQRVIAKPGDAKRVDIRYDLIDDGVGSPTPETLAVGISDDDGQTFAVPANEFEGAVGGGQTAGVDKLITWNAGLDWNGNVSPNMRFDVARLLKKPVAARTPSFANSPTLSNRTFVDTRDPVAGVLDPFAGIANLIDKKVDGNRLIRFEMTKLSLPRPENGPVTIYLQVRIPDFAGENGGWGKDQRGLGAFYGLEVKGLGGLNPSDFISYKIGGGPPSPDTIWKPATFNKIIDVPLEKEICYFKIKLAPGSKDLVVSPRFKSARLCDGDGDPIKSLNAGRQLWVITHGKNDGERSFRSMNKAVAKGTGVKQVVTLDWASGASGEFTDLTNGRYFVSLGKNVAALLKKEGFASNQVSWVGHSWGTYVGCETARGLSKVGRFTALDPAYTAGGGYDVDRVIFGKFSNIATGLKGGGGFEGFYGSEALARTCDFSIHLYSGSGSGTPGFYHNLPRDWFIRTMENAANPYWKFFHGIVIRNNVTPAMPWGGSGKIEGFNLEDHGRTFYQNDRASFVSHDYLLFKNSKGVITEARAGKNPNGSTAWTYRKH